jgi:ATP-dependent Lhr-like helicase
MISNQIGELKKRLKRTWITFFGRYGRLLPIQEKTIPVVLDRRNAIIVSSTASGKTEAVIAPLIERLLGENWEDLVILYISPTRALVNDMYYRLHEQLEELGVLVSLRTGDKPQFNTNNPPNILLTTPESFDSLLCRHHNSFRKVKVVILDEIHLMDNTYRGDQLRLLLKRLEDISEADVNVYVLSATIADPKDVGIRYLKNFEIITASGRQEIEYTFVSSLKEIFDYARKDNLKKLIFFCNKKANVEMFATECNNLWTNRVVVHHGSLSKTVREEAESFMKESQYGICIATMTLEIGIDIGDIDAVVLAEVPWSISSLLQRIGRGNRRTHKNKVFAIYKSNEEKLILEQMLKIAIEGYVEPIDYSPDLSVVVQQIFSSLYANPNGLEEDYFLKLFSGFCTADDLKEILNHLTKEGWIQKRYWKCYATTKLMDLGERGTIHSNIPTISSLRVIDVNSKSHIGEVQYPIDEVFMLDGKVWRIVGVSEDEVYVIPEKTKADAVRFKACTKSAFYYLLPKHLRRNGSDR